LNALLVGESKNKFFTGKKAESDNNREVRIQK